MTDLKERAGGLLPLTEATFIILASLLKPRHGYGIMQDAEQMSGGRIRLGPGTLYGALNNLLKQKLIERVEDEGGDDERRKAYRLTPLGKLVVELECERLAGLARLANKVKNRLGEER